VRVLKFSVETVKKFGKRFGMGNHTVDCQYCGEDMRANSWGVDHNCPEKREALKPKPEEVKKETPPPLCYQHPYAPTVAVKGPDGLFRAGCERCVAEEAVRLGKYSLNGVPEPYLFEQDTLERQEQRRLFNDWFSELLMMKGKSCLLRDILRNQKENLFSEWMKVRPYE
jgi:hypothetical protein